MSSEFLGLAEKYLHQLEALHEQDDALQADTVLACLLLRDRLAQMVRPEIEKDASAIDCLTQGDKLLIALTQSISRLPELKNWRNTLKPPQDSWWWHLSLPEQETLFTKYDWLWSAIAVALLTVALGLVVDISTRFISGGADTRGAFAIIIQSTLTMLAAGGVLTKAGRQAMERTLQRFNIDPHYWQEIQVLFAVLLVLGLIWFRFSLPRVAASYYDRGLVKYEAGNLTSAQHDYERALSLYPDYVEVHFSLGLLAEDLQDLTKARSEYRIAVQGNSPRAYNRLARLHILSQDYATAVLFLLNGLEFTEDPDLRYEMYKNLGWARLEQMRYPEARSQLLTAIDIKPEQAPAYCLLAQVFERDEKAEEALPYWSACLELADGRQPDEDTWLYVASQRIAEVSVPITRTVTLSQTATTLEADTGLNLLFGLEGDIDYKRFGWLNFHPTNSGTILQRGDQIQPADGTRVLVLCDDLSLWIVPDGVPSGVNNGCSKSDQASLIKPDFFTSTQILTPQTDGFLPYVISPQATRVLTTTPKLSWNALPREMTTLYTVTLLGDDGFRWLSTTHQTSIVYGGDAALKPGVIYSVSLAADTGSVVISQRGFDILPPEEAVRLKQQLTRIQSHTALPADALVLAQVYLYLSNGLKAEAIDILETSLETETENVAMQTLLGHLYRQLGLPFLAEQAYRQAINTLITSGHFDDLAALGEVQLGLGRVYRQLDQPQRAQQHFSRAADYFDRIGDKTLLRLVEAQFR